MFKLFPTKVRPYTRKFGSVDTREATKVKRLPVGSRMISQKGKTIS